MKPSVRALSARLVRNFVDIEKEQQTRAPLYDTACAHLSARTAASKLGASIDIVAPGKRSCPYHYHHAQEEMFVVIDGTGTLRVADEMLPLKAGDVIFIPPGPAYPHQIINTSDAALTYLSISTRESPEVIVYPDSDKVMATAAATDSEPIRLIQREADSIDYWDGEP